MKKNKFLALLSVITLFFSLFTYRVLADEVESKKDEKKVIYLTFDDGPTIKNTKRVVEILKKEQVPATFFLIGENVEHYPDLVKLLQENNMAIGAHSYSHKVHEIYKYPENYLKDLEKCIDTVEKTLGEKTIDITRMPCGSTNTICNKWTKDGIKKGIRGKGLSYVDWNVSGEDALSKNVPCEKIMRNILKDTKNQDTVVLLLHDGYYNGTTVQILPEVIKYYKDKGYTFKSLKNLSNEEKADLEKLKVLNR